MAALISISSTLALLAGFVGLTWYETRREHRFFEATRARLDTQVERITFIIEHVDFGAFLKEEIDTAFTRLGHAVAHLSLRVVRAVERLLTRIVRRLRAEHTEAAAPRENAREFVKTLSDFKETIQATHPDVDVSETP